MTHHSNSRGRILIVEDQGVVATDIERCLEEGGFEVTGIATSMKDAIREVSASRPDLVLMDIRIKGEADGIATADHLHRNFDLPIVYLTAHDDRDTMDRAKSTEPMAFLLKPFKPAELTSTVEIALKRNRIEQQVRERERSFLSAMDSIGDGVLTMDSRGLIRFMNRAAEGLTGSTQDAALGRHASEVIRIVSGHDGDGQDCGIEQFRELLDVHHHGHSDCEYRVLSAKGGYHWITFKAMTIPGANNSSVRILVMRDNTRRKMSEQALRRQADLLNQSHEPILTWDLDGTIRFWNDGAQRLYGFSPKEALGTAVGQLLPGVNPEMDSRCKSGLEQDGRWSGELTRRTKDGRVIVVEAMLVIVSDAEGRKTVLETDRDITERKNTEREVLRLNQELQSRVSDLTRLNRELESFNYSISHDLRAPLRHINGFAKLLLESPAIALSQDAREHLDTIRAAAQKMGLMVDALLELSRTSRKELVRQATNLKAVVNDVLFEVKADAGARHIDWRVGQLPEMECDPMLVRQVFANLIGNAVKFTRGREPAVIEIGQQTSQGETVLFVKDNGIGFDMKYADRLFGVFQRLHGVEEFEGTGIGLATVQRMVNKHGGRIWAEAEPDKGATFFFTLAAPAQERTSAPLPLEEIHA